MQKNTTCLRHTASQCILSLSLSFYFFIFISLSAFIHLVCEPQAPYSETSYETSASRTGLSNISMMRGWWVQCWDSTSLIVHAFIQYLTLANSTVYLIWGTAYLVGLWQNLGTWWSKNGTARAKSLLNKGIKLHQQSLFRISVTQLHFGIRLL